MSISDLLSATGALVLVICLILLLRFGNRLLVRVRPASAEAVLRVEHQLQIDSRRRLQLIRCDGQRLLLLTGGGTDTMLAWPEEPPR